MVAQLHARLQLRLRTSPNRNRNKRIYISDHQSKRSTTTTTTTDMQQIALIQEEDNVHMREQLVRDDRAPEQQRVLEPIDPRILHGGRGD